VPAGSARQWFQTVGENPPILSFEPSNLGKVELKIRSHLISIVAGGPTSQRAVPGLMAFTSIHCAEGAGLKFLIPDS
jgi:hypothetical protein